MSPSNGRGFVLPTSLLVLTLLTVMLTAAFVLVSAESRTTSSSLSAARVLGIATEGMQQYLGLNRGLLISGATTDSTRLWFADGYADVVASRLRAPTGNELGLWVIRSTAEVYQTERTGLARSRRTIAQIAQLNPGLVPARAAMVAANGVIMTGAGSNPINGDDLGSIWPCSSPSGAAADTFGLTVPAGGYGGSGGGTPGGEGPGGMDVLGSPSAVIDSTRIDWAALLGGNFTPDYVVPPSALPAPGGTQYFVYFAPGDVTIPGQGSFPSGAGRRGMLVAAGNVTMADNSHWDGIIIAGGRLSASPASADFKIHGMIITGLNISQGANVPANDVLRVSGSATREIRWTWCYTRSSQSALTTFVPFKNGLIDTWATY